MKRDGRDCNAGELECTVRSAKFKQDFASEPLMNLLGKATRSVILSEAKDLLKRIEHRKTRSFASLRMTWLRSG
jgi:hypothetical protein